MTDVQRAFDVEYDTGSAVGIYGWLANGLPDEDGQILDPDWLWEAAGDWLERSGVFLLNGDPRSAVGRAGELHRGDDGSVWLRARISGRHAVELIRDGDAASYGLGFARPFIVLDPDAPMGRVVDGELLHVWVDAPRPQATEPQSAAASQVQSRLRGLTAGRPVQPLRQIGQSHRAGGSP
jgi:hypothetical protein